MKLSSRYYDLLHTFLMDGYRANYRAIRNHIPLKKGDTILELGCGTGLLAKPFEDDGIHYVGLDLLEDRLNWAKTREPRGTYLCRDICDPSTYEDLDSKYILIHSVVHHLDDVSARNLFQLVGSIGCKVLSVIEPELPPRSNIVGRLLCGLDDGDFIRSGTQYLNLFPKDWSIETAKFKWRFWPVNLLVMTNANLRPFTPGHA